MTHKRATTGCSQSKYLVCICCGTTIANSQIYLRDTINTFSVSMIFNLIFILRIDIMILRLSVGSQRA